MRNHSNR